MRSVTVESAKKSNYTLRHMYHDTFLFKILGLLDFYTSLSLVSPAALAFVQQLADPSKLNILIQLLIGSPTRAKLIILRVF